MTASTGPATRSPDPGDEIVIGDLSAGEVVIYNGHTGDLLASFPYALNSRDRLAVCEEGLVIADESADRVDILQIDPGGPTVIGGFRREMRAGDFLLCGRVMNRTNPQFIFARGEGGSHYTSGDIEIFTYSTYNGPETPGDRYDLESLFKTDGEWARKLQPTWTANGYLLLVGEIEILPAFSCSYYLTGVGTKTVPYTDNYYGNTSGSMKKPEIAVGRIVGNNAQVMKDTVMRCVAIAAGEQVLDESSAYVVSGGPENRFDNDRNDKADQLRDKGYTVREDDEIAMETFFDRCIDRDLIYLTGHGNPTGWDGKSSWDIEDHFDPGTGAPLVYVKSCSTGRYPASTAGFAEHWLKFGASAFIGATQVSYNPWGCLLSEGFLSRYGPACPAGLALKNAKRDRMGDGNYGKYHSAIYHLFGDPKMAPAAGTVAAAEAQGESPGTKQQELSGPLNQLAVKIPMFQVNWHDTTASVRIPGGAVLAQVGHPEVPAWPVTIDFPNGYRIQDVRLTEKGDFAAGTGLPLSMVQAEVDGEQNEAGEFSMDPWPDRDLDWTVEPMPDGSSQLQIHIYPFRSWPETTNYEFFAECLLVIDSAASAASIDRLVTDRKVYGLGDAVGVNMYLIDPQGQGGDIIAEAQISGSSSNAATGLAVKRLRNLKGYGSCSWTWQTSGFPAGDYEVRVNLRRDSGLLLDTATHPFTLGTSRGAIQSLSVDPACFDKEDSITLSAVFVNTGDTILSGQTVIEMHDLAGNSLGRFSEDFSDIAPNGSRKYSPVWTAVFPRGECRFTAYAIYDGKTTDHVLFPPVSEYSDGDFDRDGLIDLADFAVLADCWRGGALKADIAPRGGDCKVDWMDLIVLVEAWMSKTN